MPTYDRGGQVLKTGKIGRVNVLRQQMLLPGERLRSSVHGGVRLTTLREPESVRIHARVDAFVQPVRWLWPDFVQYLKDGPSAAQAWPLEQVSPGPNAVGRTASDLGLGGNTGAQVLAVFEESIKRIWNEWYKWPEDADATGWPRDGWQSVNLAHSFTRLQNKPDGGAAELTTADGGSGREKFDIRALAELQEKFRQSVDQDWIAEDRYVDLLREIWGADGSREVDKVPVRLDGAEIGVSPRNVFATDAGGLGAGMSLYQFGVDHNFGTISMPEHCIVTYVLVVRFSTVAEDEVNPIALAHDRSWAEMVGEPGMLGAQRPTAVRGRNLTGAGTNVLGYLPAGWQWRARWNVVGARIDDRGSFPLLKNLASSTAKQMRNATLIGEPFQSASLGDYMVDMDFSEISASPVPGPLSSVYTGTGDRVSGPAYPYPGPRRVV